MNYKHVRFWNYQLYKYFCTNNARFTSHRESRILVKLLTKGNKKNRQNLLWGESNFPSHINTFDSYKPKILNNPRRVTVLNKLFMKYVTDHLSSFDFANKLEGKGLEITDVSIAKDYKVLNIFWFARRDLDNVEKILQSSAGIIRHHMSQERILGIVPPLQFVRNKNYYNAIQVEDIIKTMDLYKEDEDEEKEKGGTVHLEAYENGSKDKISEAEDIYDLKLPEMTHSIFNLHHATMMNKIRDDVKKATRINARKPSEITENVFDEEINFQRYKSNKKEFSTMSEFLKSRAVNQRRRDVFSLEKLWNEKLKEDDEINTLNDGTDYYEDNDEYFYDTEDQTEDTEKS